MDELPVRGRARDVLVAAAQRMLAEVRFADLAAFITVRELTQRTGLSNGAIYGAFRSRPASSSALTAPAAAARAALREVVKGTREAVDEGAFRAAVAATSDDPAAGVRAQSLAAVEQWSRGILADQFTMVLLAAAVAPRDEGIREELCDHYRGQLERDERLADAAWEAWGRRLRPDVTLSDAARILLGLAEGLALQARAQGEVDADLAALAGTVVTRGLTVPTDGVPVLDGEPPSLPGEPLPADVAQRVAAAVQVLYDRGGWAGVDEAAVAAASGIDRAELQRAYPTRNAFARHVWERLADSTVRMADRLGGLSPRERASWLVHQLAEQVASHRSAALAMVSEDQRLLAVSGTRDPASAPMVPVTLLLVSILAEDRVGFGLPEQPQLLGGQERAVVLAQFLVGSVMVAATRQPWLDAASVADFVLDTCLPAR